MRIAVGQLWQETNTFNRNQTSMIDFENWGVAVGDEVVTQYGQTGELGGFLDACRDWDTPVEFVGLGRFACWPWGSIDSETWAYIRETFQQQLAAQEPVDAVFLALHGALAADGEPDVTGAILADMREMVGPDIPIVGSLDLHANITKRMLEQADVLSGYHTAPHLDARETGQRAAGALRRIMTESIEPVTYSVKLPMITAAENHDTFNGPPASLYRRVRELEQEPEVLSAGLYMAMPWFDCPHLGWTVTLTVNARDTRWKKAVDELAASCWEMRETIERVERFPPDEVVERALGVSGHPVVIGEGADATNSGSPGDSTHLLRAFLACESIPHGALTFLVDPEAVAVAVQAGVDRTFDALVGGCFAPEYSAPIRLRGTVERLVDVDFVLDGHIGKNLPIHMGRGAVIRSGDVTVLLTEKSGPGSTPLLYETAGLDPRTFGIVVAKSPSGFRADYGPFAAAIFSADCPGCAGTNWPRMNFHQVHRPLYPLQTLGSPSEAGWCWSEWTR